MGTASLKFIIIRSHFRGFSGTEAVQWAAMATNNTTAITNYTKSIYDNSNGFRLFGNFVLAALLLYNASNFLCECAHVPEAAVSCFSVSHLAPAAEATYKNLPMEETHRARRCLGQILTLSNIRVLNCSLSTWWGVRVCQWKIRKTNKENFRTKVKIETWARLRRFR